MRWVATKAVLAVTGVGATAFAMGWVMYWLERDVGLGPLAPVVVMSAAFFALLGVAIYSDWRGRR